jgi:hypothetical protein
MTPSPASGRSNVNSYTISSLWASTSAGPSCGRAVGRGKYLRPVCVLLYLFRHSLVPVRPDLKSRVPPPLSPRVWNLPCPPMSLLEAQPKCQGRPLPHPCFQVFPGTWGCPLWHLVGPGEWRTLSVQESELMPLSLTLPDCIYPFYNTIRHWHGSERATLEHPTGIQAVEVKASL